MKGKIISRRGFLKSCAIAVGLASLAAAGIAIHKAHKNSAALDQILKNRPELSASEVKAKLVRFERIEQESYNLVRELTKTSPEDFVNFDSGMGWIYHDPSLDLQGRYFNSMTQRPPKNSKGQGRMLMFHGPEIKIARYNLDAMKKPKPRYRHSLDGNLVEIHYSLGDPLYHQGPKFVSITKADCQIIYRNQGDEEEWKKEFNDLIEVINLRKGEKWPAPYTRTASDREVKKYLELVEILEQKFCSENRGKVNIPRSSQPKKEQQLPPDAVIPDYLKQALEYAQEKNKPVLLLCSGKDWCPFCLKLEDEIINTHQFQQYTGTNDYRLLVVDLSRHNPQTPAQKQANEQIRKLYNVNSFPTMLVLNPDGNVLQRISGYKPGGPENFIRLLEQAINQ